MKRMFLGVFLLLILLMAGTFIFFQWNAVEGTWRYKITLNVETPEGGRSGFAVREILNEANKIKIFDLPEATNSPYVSGEAVVVNLGERGYLFALIDWDSYYEFIKVFPYTAQKGTADSIHYYSSLEVGLKGELKDQEYWPLMVTFKDMNDARTVIPIYEIGRCFDSKNHPDCNGSNGTFEKVNRLEEVFGKGVKVKNIIIEVTDEPKTKTGILEMLPKFDEEFWRWLKTLKYGDSRRVSGANFSRGTIE